MPIPSTFRPDYQPTQLIPSTTAASGSGGTTITRSPTDPSQATASVLAGIVATLPPTPTTQGPFWLGAALAQTAPQIVVGPVNSSQRAAINQANSLWPYPPTSTQPARGSMWLGALLAGTAPFPVISPVDSRSRATATVLANLPPPPQPLQGPRWLGSVFAQPLTQITQSPIPAYQQTQIVLAWEVPYSQPPTGTGIAALLPVPSFTPQAPIALAQNLWAVLLNAPGTPPTPTLPWLGAALAQQAPVINQTPITAAQQTAVVLAWQPGTTQPPIPPGIAALLPPPSFLLRAPLSANQNTLTVYAALAALNPQQQKAVLGALLASTAPTIPPTLPVSRAAASVLAGVPFLLPTQGPRWLAGTLAPPVIVVILVPRAVVTLGPTPQASVAFAPLSQAAVSVPMTTATAVAGAVPTSSATLQGLPQATVTVP